MNREAYASKNGEEAYTALSSNIEEIARNRGLNDRETRLYRAIASAQAEIALYNLVRTIEAMRQNLERRMATIEKES